VCLQAERKERAPRNKRVHAFQRDSFVLLRGERTLRPGNRMDRLIRRFFPEPGIFASGVTPLSQALLPQATCASESAPAPIDQRLRTRSVARPIAGDRSTLHRFVWACPEPAKPMMVARLRCVLTQKRNGRQVQASPGPVTARDVGRLRWVAVCSAGRRNVSEGDSPNSSR
jgi:hypothetical protein